MTNLTATYVCNLLNHKPEDLAVVIETIENQIREYQCEIATKQGLLEDAEDFEGGLKAKVEQSIEERRNRIQSLLAWKLIFSGAIDRVKSL